MDEIFKTILIISVAVFGAGFLSAPFANATQVDKLVVEYWSDAQNNWLPLSGPIFSETNFLPGQSVTRLVRVTNNNGQSWRIATEAINYSNPIPAGDLSRALMFIIKEGAMDLYGGSSPTGPKSLYDFYQDSEIYSEISLSDLASGNTTQYDFIISFPSEKEKEWQNATTTFDILIGFQSGASPLPPSPPASPSSGGGGGGTGYYLPPGLIIQSETVRTTNIEEESVTIAWDTSYFSTSQVIYGKDGENHTLDLTDSTGTPPKYGYSHTTPEFDVSPKVASHSVTVYGLTPGTKYYFRAISHGSLAISREYDFSTKGIASAAGGVIPREPAGKSVMEAAANNTGPVNIPGETGIAAAPVMEIPSGAINGENNAAEKTAYGKESSGFLAAISFLLVGWKSILILAGIILLILIVFWLIRRKKKEDKNFSSQIDIL